MDKLEIVIGDDSSTKVFGSIDGKKYELKFDEIPDSIKKLFMAVATDKPL